MITLRNVTIHQGSFSLTDINLSLDEGAYGILMGETGCGKTTLLESICGLRKIAGGKILLGSRDVTQLSPAQRQIGYVPQDSVLFPTMRIDQQIEFGLKAWKIKRASRKQRIAELAELLDLRPLLGRYPQGLSGGERQRVALARALSFRPQLLCLDEPLSALDATTRSRMSELLKTVHQNEDVTVLHITHSALEGQQLGTVHFQLKGRQVVERRASMKVRKD